jgi:hypothetical protein
MKMTGMIRGVSLAAAAILLIALTPVASASAAVGINVSCSFGAPGLVAAINVANSSGGGTIIVDPGCTYSLSSANNTNSNSMIGSNGLPVITSQITIIGNDTTIAANKTNFRIFEVDGPGGNLTLQGIILTGGHSFAGGALLNVQGTVTLNQSEVTGNAATGGGGGIASGVVNPNGVGPSGVLTLNQSAVTANASPGGGGGGILNRAGTLNLNYSAVDGNTALNGGGIASGTGNGGTAGGSVLNINNSQVEGNTATVGGGGLGAGGIANGGTATITNSEINDNSAPGAIGGGVLNHGTMSISLSQVLDNTAPNDVTGNAGIGGGIANIDFGLPNSGILSISLTQISGNSASGVGGGIAEASVNLMTGSTSAGNTLNITLTQVTDNSSALGGGIYSVPGSPVKLRRSVVADNSPNNCAPTKSVKRCRH